MDSASTADPNGRLAVLRCGMAALNLVATDERLAQLEAYLELLNKWNRHYNLTAVRDPTAMLYHHLLDCLAVVEPLDRQLQGRAVRLLDVGSGAGLPGVVLSIMRPHWSISCVDAVAKKATFVRQVAGELSLRNLQSLHARVEALDSAPFGVVISRAFASLLDFTTLTRRHLTATGLWLAMKGKIPVEEIEAMPRDVEVFHVEPVAVPGLSAQRCLVWMRPV
jgi:16S rRNA (guanine527-N7)-methyltransferase